MLDLPPVAPIVIEKACDNDFSAYIKRYSKLTNVRQDDGGESELREQRRIQAIAREAKIVGSAAGRVYRGNQITSILKSPRANEVLNSFSFRELMYKTKIVPPVITEIGPSVAIEDNGRVAKTTRKSWRIIRPAYIHTGVPTWQSYLTAGSAQAPRERGIYNFYAPKSDSDRKLWKENYCMGYATGFNTANEEFMQNLNRFTRDYIGMIRFKNLEQAGIVSPPEVRETRVGIVVDDAWTAIDQRDFRITVDSKFKQQDEWDNTFIKDD